MKRDASKEQFWREAIAEAESSGQSAREFCGQKGLKEGLFHSWRRTLRLRDAEAGEKSGFVELVRAGAPTAWAGVSIRVDERIRVVLERGFDHETLKATLGCLCAVPTPQRGGRASAGARAQPDGTRTP